MEQKNTDELINYLAQTAQPNKTKFREKLLTRLEQEHIRPEVHQERSSRVGSTYVLRFAFSMVIVLILSVGGYYWMIPSPKSMASIVASVGTLSISDQDRDEGKVKQGEWIQSQEDGQASLLLSDYSVVRMDHDTTLKIQKRRNVVLKHGRLFAEITRTTSKDRFTIHTPEAQLTVLGTAFEVFSHNQETTVTVTEGKVQVEWDERSEVVSAGESITVAASSTVKPKHVVKEEGFDWFSQLKKLESQSPVIQAMRKHFPSRSLDLNK